MSNDRIEVSSVPMEPKARRQWDLETHVRLNYQQPIDRSYAYAIVQTDKGPSDVRISNRQNAEIILGSLLPEGWRIQRGKSAGVNHEDRILTYDSNSLMFRGSILAILHEISHAQLGEGPTGEIIKRIGARAALTSLAKEGVYKIRTISANLRGKPLEKPDPVSFLPNDIIQKIFEHRASNERNAWSRALAMAKDLEKAGFNVLGEFGKGKEGFQSIVDYINFKLISYELGHRDAMSLVKRFVPSKPLFVNR